MYGRLHGSNTGYFADGKVRHQYTFKDGAKVGTNTDYYHNGQIQTQEKFTNGFDSELNAFDSLGTKQFEKHFRKGKPHGSWLLYMANGKNLSAKETYLDGQLNGLRTTYHLNGQKKTEEMWKFDMLTGPVKNFYEDGKLLSQCDFRGNRMHGLYTSYWPNGKIKEQGEYVANKKHKEWKEFDEEGKLVKSLMFKAGILINP